MIQEFSWVVTIVTRLAQQYRITVNSPVAVATINKIVIVDICHHRWRLYAFASSISSLVLLLRLCKIAASGLSFSLKQPNP